MYNRNLFFVSCLFLSFLFSSVNAHDTTQIISELTQRMDTQSIKSIKENIGSMDIDQLEKLKFRYDTILLSEFTIGDRCDLIKHLKTISDNRVTDGHYEYAFSKLFNSKMKSGERIGLVLSMAQISRYDSCYMEEFANTCDKLIKQCPDRVRTIKAVSGIRPDVFKKLVKVIDDIKIPRANALIIETLKGVVPENADDLVNLCSYLSRELSLDDKFYVILAASKLSSTDYVLFGESCKKLFNLITHITWRIHVIEFVAETLTSHWPMFDKTEFKETFHTLAKDIRLEDKVQVLSLLTVTGESILWKKLIAYSIRNPSFFKSIPLLRLIHVIKKNKEIYHEGGDVLEKTLEYFDKKYIYPPVAVSRSHPVKRPRE
ncbi:MAG: hypothetical protein Q8R43_03590 [Alphaproteobacteria bacterium]|nr:hypothetical protein [Alphaproteobacteria bacterium]